MRIEQLLDGVADAILHGDGRFDVTGVTLDSRRVHPGHVFAAITGHADDGRRYVADAVRRGAVAVLSPSPRPEGLARDTAWIDCELPRKTIAEIARRFFASPDERLQIVGVTGTDGKTSLVAIAAGALSKAGQRTATLGTLGRSFGAGHEPTPLTTPEAPELWAFFADAIRRECSIAAIEVSSVGLVEERVHGVRFAGAVLTGIGRDHFDYHGNAANYRRAKLKLFETLARDAFALLPSHEQFDDFRSATGARVISFGCDEGADWRVVDHRRERRGARFRLVGIDFDQIVDTQRATLWDALNIAASVAMASALGLDPLRALAGAASTESIPGRWETIDEGQGFVAIVDFAHTPEALERALRELGRTASGKIVVVFGCGGERDRGKREAMGRAAGLCADLVVVTDDNPRSEDPELIARQVIEGASAGNAEVRRIADRAQAIVEAVSCANDGDAVLVAGKGHETYQDFASRRVGFDDRTTLRAAIRAREVES